MEKPSIGNIYIFNVLYISLIKIGFSVDSRTKSIKGKGIQPWLVWPSGLSARLQTEGLLIPRQGTCLGFGPGPQLGLQERQLIDVSLTH